MGTSFDSLFVYLLSLLVIVQQIFSQMPRLDLVPVVVNSVSWIACWAAQWPMVFTSGCLLSKVTFRATSWLLRDTTILRRYSKQRSYPPTRVALTNPYTTTSSCSAIWNSGTLLYCSIVVFSLIFTGTLSSGPYYCISVVLQFGLLRMPRSIVQRYFQLAF